MCFLCFSLSSLPLYCMFNNVCNVVLFSSAFVVVDALNYDTFFFVSSLTPATLRMCFCTFVQQEKKNTQKDEAAIIITIVFIFSLIVIIVIKETKIKAIVCVCVNGPELSDSCILFDFIYQCAVVNEHLTKLTVRVV